MTPLDVFNLIWAQQIGAALPLIETVNFGVDTNDLPEKWAAVVYQPDETTDVTMGSTPWVEETGQFLIGLFARSGSGPTVLDAEIKLVRDALHGAARDNLAIFQVNGPHDLDPEADGEWWRLALTARYTFQGIRSQDGPLYHGWAGFTEQPATVH
jgi:hypothetical protein